MYEKNSDGVYDVVFVSLEAGDTSNKKKKILQNIIDTAKPTVHILARGDAKHGGSEFVNLADCLPKELSVEKSISVFDGMSKTYLLKRKLND